MFEELSASSSTILEIIWYKYRRLRLNGFTVLQSGNIDGGSHAEIRFLHSRRGFGVLNNSSRSPTVEMSQEFTATDRQTLRLRWPVAVQSCYSACHRYRAPLLFNDKCLLHNLSISGIRLLGCVWHHRLSTWIPGFYHAGAMIHAHLPGVFNAAADC